MVIAWLCLSLSPLEQNMNTKKYRSGRLILILTVRSKFIGENLVRHLIRCVKIALYLKWHNCSSSDCLPNHMISNECMVFLES